MRKVSLLLSSILFFALSCTQKSDEVGFIKAYYAAINNFELESIPEFYYDSIRMKENDYLYVAAKDSFYIKLQWDSVFRPKYKLIEIEKVDDGIIVEVSKTDPRILFLNEEPTIYREHFILREGLIYSSETQEFVLFNWDTWDKNRSELVGWIYKNHPELNGFIYDQTKQGALNYLEAMKLFKNSH